MRTLDVAEGKRYQRELKQQKQDFYCKRQYLKTAFNQEVREKYETMVQETKFNTIGAEQAATDINPRLTAILKKPD